MTQETPLRLLIVESRFYEKISDELLAGAKALLDSRGIGYDVATVPGAFEVPTVIAMAEDAAHRPMGRSYDGYVALGCVIRGETTHYDYVCQESARGLMTLGVERRLAIGYGILTVETEAQAWKRALRTEGNKGAFAASAALTLISVHKALNGGRHG